MRTYRKGIRAPNAYAEESDDMLRSHVAWLLTAAEERPELRADLAIASRELADREP